MRWAFWWFAIFAAYVITVDAQNGGEIVAGAIVAALCTAIVRVALLNGEPDVRERWTRLRHLSGVPRQMLHDAFMVAGRILRSLRTGEPLTGYFVRVGYRPAESEAFDQGREALAIIGICAAPNTIVCEVDRRGTLLVHQLLARDMPHESDEWPL